jgi:polyketide synthase PksJ
MKKKLLDISQSNLDIFTSKDVVKGKPAENKDIAIIGTAVKIKDVDNIEDFWKYLAGGVDCIGEIPEPRKKDIETFLSMMNQDTNRIKYRELTYLNEIDKFDYSFFKLSPKEASLMDPNQRLFLQVAWHAIEDAGYGGNKLTGTRTGVFVGYTGQSEGYRKLVSILAPGEEMQAMPGNLDPIISSRISYLMDLKGPAVIVNTACSSGLVALHMACRSIRMGESSQAIAGAVKIDLLPLDTGVKSEIMSSDGRTKAFDDSSDGTGAGEGVIALLLKPLNKAIKDGDHIAAVIKGSAINQDGSSIGITAPNARAQADVITKAWKDANIDPKTISFIETHGTGTKLGDPIEIEGITQAFKRYTHEKQFCVIGSVKTNIGHLDNAAGLAGLLKAVLTLKNRQIPPLVHFKKPNRQIDFENSPVCINRKLMEWKPHGYPRRCGISSFGLSGTNCHVILEQAPAREIPAAKELNRQQILTLSSRSLPALEELIEKYRTFLEKNNEVNLRDICCTANTGRGHYNHRLALLIKNKQDLKHKLDKLAECDFIRENMKDVFYAQFRIVPFNKKVKEKNNITEEERKQISEAVKRKNVDELGEIAMLYVQGADVDWEKFYKNRNEKYFKVSLPGYPFERNRCWLEPKDTINKKVKSKHLYQSPVRPISKYSKELEFTLLDRCLAESVSAEIYTTIFSLDKYWLLREHKVASHFMLVGTAYLELAVEVCRKLYPHAAVRLHDLVIITPLIVGDDRGNEVQTIVRIEKDCLEFKVVSREDNHETNNDNDNPWQEYANGKIVPIFEPEKEKSYLNINQIKKTCPTVYHAAADEKERKNDSFIQTGPRWNNLKTVYTGENQSLGFLELPPEFNDDLDEFFLHPPLMDTALHIAAGSGQTPYLPLMYKKAYIYGKTPPRLYSYIKKKSPHNDNAETLSFDITLMNTSGEVFAVFVDYTMKKVHPGIDIGISTGIGSIEKQNLYYEIGWIPSALKREDKREESPGPSIMVMKDKSERAAKIVKKLKENSRKVIEIGYGSQYKKITACKYMVTGKEEDFNQILEEIKERNIDRVIHLSAIREDEDNEIKTLERLEKNQVKGVFSLFYLTRALVKRKVSGSDGIDLVLMAEYVTSVTGTEEAIMPENSTLFGLAKVVRQEYPHLKCRCIDIDKKTSVDTILREINSKNGSFQVAYRQNTRYIEEFRKINIHELENDRINIKENGVYIITGALGGIGLELSKYLASQNKVKLILVNRSSMPGKDSWEKILKKNEDKKLVQKINAVKTIEKTGSEVVCFPADVCDIKRMEEIFIKVRATFGGINGMIHCAGNAGDGFLVNKDEAIFREVLMPKVHGTWILANLTHSDHIDFFILCSSLTAFFGAPGQGDYTAGNCYLDSFAFYRSKSKGNQGQKTLSINWTGWRETGMAKDHGGAVDGIFKSIGNADALQALTVISNKKISRVFLGELDYSMVAAMETHVPVNLSAEIFQLLKTRQHKPANLIRTGVKLNGRNNDNYSDTEKKIAHIWAQSLGFHEIDIYDNFYDMGGDSINALNIINHINKELGTGFTVVDIFNHLTIEAFARYMDETQKEKNKTGTAAYTAITAIKPFKKSDYFPVSAAQRRLFILNQFDKTSTGYNLPDVRIIEGIPDKKRLENIFKGLIKRHESLRTSFALQEDTPVQVVHDYEEIDFEIMHAPVTGDQVPVEVRKFIRSFDLNKAPLLRVGLLQIPEDHFVLMFDIHHIIADAMSCERLIEEFVMLYNGANLPELEIQYKDFAIWQNELFASGKINKQKEYWLNQFKDNIPVLDLPTDFPRPDIQSFAGDTVSVFMDEVLTTKTKEFAKKNEVTLYMILLAVYYVILYRYSGYKEQEDIVIGSLSLGRSHAELERVIGMFVNTLPIRNYPTANKTFADFLAEVKTSALQAFENQDFQFDELVENLDIEKDFSRNPLADIWFSFMSFDKPSTATPGPLKLKVDLKVRPYKGLLKKSSKADITLFCTESNTIAFSFEYCSALFKKETMQRFAQHFINIVQYVIHHPCTRLSHIDFLSAAEKKQLVETFNNTAAEYPADKTIHKLFEEQAARTPDNTALVAPKIKYRTHMTYMPYITYRELNETSDQLASLLKEKGIKPDTIIGIMMDRSVEMIIGLLGILKAGGAYLPMDPEYPQRRIKYILEKSSVRILLTRADLIGKCKEITLTGEILDITARNLYLKNKPGNRADALTVKPSAPGDLAYVIYTSGSTGNPKGILVRHKNVINFIKGMTSKIGFSPGKTILALTTISFDIFLLETLLPVTCGLKVVTADENQQKDPGLLAGVILKHQVNMLQLTPASLKSLLSSRDDLRCLQGVEELMVGGEPFPKNLFERVKEKYQGKIYNLYGPTETTVWSTIKYLTSTLPQDLNIGKPISNTRIYIVNSHNRLQPPGIPGELLIAGAGVGAGYLNNPELTAEKFYLRRPGGALFEKTAPPGPPRKNFLLEGTRGLAPLLSGKNPRQPYSHAPIPSPQSPIYHTGDLARWLPNGEIEFLQRIDQQVKLRGFRIQLEEIENQLLNHQDIKEVVVIDKEEENNEKYLCAYIVCADEVMSHQALNSTELKKFLSLTLPDYMIPSMFIQLEEIPLTPNGKVDRKALGLYEHGKRLKTGVEYAAPQNNIEKIIANTWKKLLQTDEIGIHDNFFDLGGNSLKIIRLNNQLKDIFKQDIPVVTMFRYPTIHALSRYLSAEGASPMPMFPEKAETREKGIPHAPGMGNGTEIAVIGMAGRFPGAKNINEFWNNLKNGIESIIFFTDQEVEEAYVSPQMLQDTNYVKAGGVLTGCEYFDAPFFGYTPKEALVMDPQTRIFHECAVEALENAGYHPESYHGSIGLYAGASSSFFWEGLSVLTGQTQSLGQYASEKLANKDFLCTRISYNLNLKGPGSAVQTACSTSLVAVHQACLSLLTGDCDMALAGGITVSPSPKQGYSYEEGMVSSSDGHCRAFDAKANGTVFGSGAGIVVLKPLQQALADRDYIHAVIKGSASNNDGSRKVGYTAPSIEGQAEAIRKALHTAAVEPETISYIETHGTGTNLGDLVEIEALKLAFNTKKRGYCGIGSVKTNVGHLDSAAGIAGFIKTVLALVHRLIPPSLHFETPNPEIDLENSPFYINTGLKEWKRNGYPLRAGVSSFGIGGTNAHVILEEAPEGTGGLTHLSGRKYQLILLSAKTPSALDKMTENLAEYFKRNLLNRGNLENLTNPGPTLADAAYTLQVGRGTYPYKRMAVCSHVNEAVETLTDPETRKVETICTKEDNPSIIFMFPGQGSQYVNMGLELYKTEPVFRQEMNRCFEILKPLMGYDIKEILYPGDLAIRDGSPYPPNPLNSPFERGGREADGVCHSPLERGAPEGRGVSKPVTYNLHLLSDINQTEIAQPVIFSIQFAMAKLLIKWGIKPHAMVGHSIGEYVVAHLSGVFSLENALKLVAWRGQMMQRMPPGSMLSVPLSEEELKSLVNENKDLSIAAVNSSSRCVVSGPHQAIESFENILKEKGHETRRLHTSHAFHSNMMDPILEEFEKRLKQTQLKLNKPQIPYILNVTGDWASAETAANPAYWAAHLRKTVRFADGITKLLKLENANGNKVFVEIGPGNVLSTFVKQHRDYDKKQGPPIINLIRHPQENAADHQCLLKQLGKLWLYGKKPDWYAFYSGEKGHRIPLPTYPFQGQRYWIEGDPLRTGFEKMSTRTLPPRKPDMADWFYIPSWERSVLQASSTLKRKSSYCWLVFIYENGPGSWLVKRLEQDDEDVITIRPGSGFNKVSPGKYILNPAEKNDYNSLFRELNKLKKVPARIAHLWCISDNKDKVPGLESIDIDTSQDIGFFSLLNIVQAIENESITDELQIGVITDNMQEVTGEELLCPEKATVLGAVKVIPLEYPNIKCSSIDIVVPGPGDHPEDKLIDYLLEEFKSDFSQNIVAFRGNHRWVQTMKPHRLDKSAQEAQRLREKGVYLITGGLGGMGFTLAEYLAKSVKASLILVGRSPFPPRKEWEKWLLLHGEEDRVSHKIKKVQELEKNGAEIMIVRADAANLNQMQQIIARVKKRFGQINGVLHTAGIADYEGVIQRRTREMTEKIMAPKIMGTLVLGTILQDFKPDFFVLFSSIGNILYKMKFGQVGYNAANEFIEAYACYKTYKDGIFTVAINWSDWREVGMTVEAIKRKALEKEENPDLESQLYGALTPSEGVDVFNRILENNLVRVTVSTRDLEILLNRMNREQIEKANSQAVLNKPGLSGTIPMHQRPEMSTQYIAPRNETEQILADIWQEFLGIEPIGINDDFFQLGGDSLVAVQLILRINKTFQTKLSSHILLRENTIEALARLIAAGQALSSSFLVEIQAGKRRDQPFFLVHPIGGHVYCYRDLAEALGPDQPVYGLQARGLDGETEPLADIEEMAVQYINVLRTVQPEGPYHIGGSSFGGMVAFEMAQQLHVMEQEVALLFMIDTPPPGNMPPEFKDDAGILAYLFNLIDKNSVVSAEHLRRMGTDDQRKFILEHGGFAEKENPEAVLNQVRHLLKIYKVHARAMFNYKPRIYPGQFIFFQPNQWSPFNVKNPKQAWGKLSAGGIIIHNIPGDHMTMNDFPHVEVVAEVLKKRLAVSSKIDIL